MARRGGGQFEYVGRVGGRANHNKHSDTREDDDGEKNAAAGEDGGEDDVRENDCARRR